MTGTAEATPTEAAPGGSAGFTAGADAGSPSQLSRSRTARILGLLAYLGLVMAGTVVVIRPSSLAWSGGFIAGHYAQGAPPYGDHLQTSYYLWLWAHALTSLAHVPWTDPYQFIGLGHQLPQPFGWPLILVSVPVDLLAGPVAAYNALVLFAFPACAAATYALARSLGLSPPAGAVAGFAFAFEPFRVLQGTGHINALLAPLLPLLILCAELALRRRGRRSQVAAWGCAVTFVSIMASAELQLAVYAAFLLIGWVILRAPGLSRQHLRTLVWPLAAMLIGALAVAVVDVVYVLGPSATAHGQSAAMAAAYAPGVRSLLSSSVPPQGERYIYPGVVIASLAAVGLVWSICRGGRRLLAVGLLLGLGIIAFVAIGPSLTKYPAIQQTARAIPPLSYIRVPGRIDIAAGVILAVLAAMGVQAFRPPTLRVLVAVVALVGIIIELPAGFYSSNPVPPPLAVVPARSVVLDLPPFAPTDARASNYGYEAVGHPIRIAGGYSPFATPAIIAAVSDLTGIAGVPVDSCLWARLVSRHSIEYVAVHTGLYDVTTDVWHTTGEALVAALGQTAGFTRVGVAQPGGIVTFKVVAASLACPVSTPNLGTRIHPGRLPVPAPPRRAA